MPTCQHAKTCHKHAKGSCQNMPKVHAKTCQCCCKLPNSFKLCSTLDQNTRTSKDESSRISDFHIVCQSTNWSMPKARSEMYQRLDLAFSFLYEDGEAAFRIALGNPRQWSFSMHKKLFYKYTVLYVLSTGRVVDEHPHFVHSSCNEQAFFYKSVLSGLNLSRGLKTLKARRPKNNSRGRPVGPLILLPKKAQLRSKTASSSTTQKVEVLLKGEKRLNFAPKRPL